MYSSNLLLLEQVIEVSPCGCQREGFFFLSFAACQGRFFSLSYTPPPECSWWCAGRFHWWTLGRSMALCHCCRSGVCALLLVWCMWVPFLRWGCKALSGSPSAVEGVMRYAGPPATLRKDETPFCWSVVFTGSSGCRRGQNTEKQMIIIIVTIHPHLPLIMSVC